MPLDMKSIDYNRIVHEFNDTCQAFDDECIHKLFHKQAISSPSATALELGRRSMSYRTLLHQAQHLASYLHNQAAVAETGCVSLMAPRSFEFMIGLLGILWTGAFLPIDLDLPDQRIRNMLEDANAAMVVLTEPVSRTMPAIVTKVCVEAAVATQSEWQYARHVQPTDLMYVLFTSGSTGRPKGVMVEHRSAANFACGLDAVVNVRSTDRWFQWFSPSFDPSIMDYILPLLNGATLLLWHGDDKATALERANASITGITPGVMRQHNPAHLSTLRLVSPCGDPLPLALGQQWTSHMKVVNGYGPTEATIYTSTYTVQKGDKCMSIGKPLANYLCYVLLDELQPGPIGSQGELHVGGIGVARGYINRPDLTAERFVPNRFADGRLYKTGDLASWTEDGHLLCCGRIDHQVKLRGQRLELSEIEAVADGFTGITESAAILSNKDEPSAHLQLYVTGINVDSTALRGWLEGRLASYMVPRHVFVIEDMPRNPSGKLDRKSLPFVNVSQLDGQRVTSSMLLRMHDNPQAHDATHVHDQQSETLRALLELATYATGMPASPDTSTLTIGLDSIASVGFARAVSRRFEKQVSARELVSYPTLYVMAQALDDSRLTKGAFEAGYLHNSRRSRSIDDEKHASAAVACDNMTRLRGLLVLCTMLTHWLETNKFVDAAVQIENREIISLWFCLLAGWTISQQYRTRSPTLGWLSWLCFCCIRFFPMYWVAVSLNLLLKGIESWTIWTTITWFAGLTGWIGGPLADAQLELSCGSGLSIADAPCEGQELWFVSSYLTFVVFVPAVDILTRHIFLTHQLTVLAIVMLTCCISFKLAQAICLKHTISAPWPIDTLNSLNYVRNNCKMTDHWPPFNFLYFLAGTVAGSSLEALQNLPAMALFSDAGFIVHVYVMLIPPSVAYRLTHPEETAFIEVCFRTVLVATMMSATLGAVQDYGMMTRMLRLLPFHRLGGLALPIYLIHRPVLLARVSLFPLSPLLISDAIGLFVIILFLAYSLTEASAFVTRSSYSCMHAPSLL